MRASLLVVFSFFAAVVAQNIPTAPVLDSVVQNENNQYATIRWTPTYRCDPVVDMACWFTIWRDDDIQIEWIMDMNYDSYGYPAYFGDDLTFGAHTFYVKHETFMGPSPNSNVLAVTFTPPAPVTPPGDIVGDPQFMGLKGQVYQVHGAPNEVFNIISDSDLQYNSKFVYLDRGNCPTSEGVTVDTACFTHPGTYLGELGLETSNGDRVFIKAGGAEFGFAKVELNGARVTMNEVIELAPNGFLVQNSSHVLTMQAGNFRLEFTNSDMFVNQVVEMLDTSRTSSHGLLGQSWSTKVHNAKASIPWIEGTVWDYAVEDHKVFSNKFTFNKFQTHPQREAMADKVQPVVQQVDNAMQKIKQQAKNRLLKNKK